MDLLALNKLEAELHAQEASVDTAKADAVTLLSQPGITNGDLETFWTNHRQDFCDWSKRLQHFPFSLIGFIRHLGELGQNLVQLLDKFFGITTGPCT